MRNLTIFHALVCCLVVSTAIAHPTYTLRKARYCSDKRWWGCKTWKDSALGSRLSSAGVSSSQRKKVYYSIFNQPSTIKYIAFFASGQQGSSGGGQEDNVVSGAIDGWRNAHGSEGETAQTTFHSSSMAVKFHTNAGSVYWPTSQTFIISLPNSNFNHMHSSSEKTEYLNGYADYLNSVIGGSWSNIEGVYLAGSSRGGCLAMRLSQTLRTRFSLPSSVKFVVQSIDGVCKKSQGEFGTTSTTVDNPLSSAPSGYKAYATNLLSQFPSSVRSRYCIRHLAAGQEVTGVALGVRAFSHSTSTSAYSELTYSGFAWYRQQWADKCHTCLGRDYNLAYLTITPMLSHFVTCKNHFA